MSDPPVQFLVLDEADRLLDVGFQDEMQTIFGSLPQERQTLLFSATMTPNLHAAKVGEHKDPSAWPLSLGLRAPVFLPPPAQAGRWTLLCRAAVLLSKHEAGRACWGWKEGWAARASSVRGMDGLVPRRPCSSSLCACACEVRRT